MEEWIARVGRMGGAPGRGLGERQRRRRLAGRRRRPSVHLRRVPHPRRHRRCQPGRPGRAGPAVRPAGQAPPPPTAPAPAAAATAASRRPGEPGPPRSACGKRWSRPSSARPSTWSPAPAASQGSCAAAARRPPGRAEPAPGRRGQHRHPGRDPPRGHPAGPALPVPRWLRPARRRLRDPPPDPQGGRRQDLRQGLRPVLHLPPPGRDPPVGLDRRAQPRRHHHRLEQRQNQDPPQPQPPGPARVTTRPADHNSRGTTSQTRAPDDACQGNERRDVIRCCSPLIAWSPDGFAGAELGSPAKAGGCGAIARVKARLKWAALRKPQLVATSATARWLS